MGDHAWAAANDRALTRKVLSMPLSLEEMLGEKPATPAPAATEAPQTGESAQPAIPQDKPAEAAPAPATGQPTGEKTDGAPPAPDKDPQDAVRETRAFQRAAEDERKKRQDIERERDDLRRQNAEYQAYVQRVQQQSQKPAPQPRPDFLDPEGVQYLQGYLQQTLQERDALFGQQFLETKVVQSQEMMRSRHPDYDEVEAVFAEAMDQNPSLHREMQSHPMPALYAYQVGKRIKAMKEIGDDPTAYRNKLKEEILAELQQATPPAQQPKSLTPQAPPPPPSLAGVPSASTRIAQTWQGPTPLDDLLSQPINRRR